MSTHVPIRSCVGCRTKDRRSALVRLVIDHRSDDHPVVTVDRSACAPGRGVWVHEHPRCLDRALTTRAFPRGLRTTRAVDLSQVTEWLHTIRR
ncbi:MULTISPECIES: YlxR family protein [unclassified Pseudactinotalea]|uniref:YlxR family protein n=1 Tax=unclassified Pseudactinotalea TaxID=2649176 RepID=UPI00128D7A63|nr:DUF448 domain-containing protein [Pseudactinotalea sp. HY160]QGH69884.1 DUF448 domain-containing protein [Pseudactinotalea sp. HY158]